MMSSEHIIILLNSKEDAATGTPVEPTHPWKGLVDTSSAMLCEFVEELVDTIAREIRHKYVTIPLKNGYVISGRILSVGYGTGGYPSRPQSFVFVTHGKRRIEAAITYDDSTPVNIEVATAASRK